MDESLFDTQFKHGIPAARAGAQMEMSNRQSQNQVTHFNLLEQERKGENNEKVRDVTERTSLMTGGENGRYIFTH